MRLGTAFSYFATPLARMFGAPCVDPATGDLRPESTCAKVRDAMDEGRWRDAAYDFIWRRGNTEGSIPEINNMSNGKELKEWIIVHQMGVTAPTWQEAMGLMDQAETLAVTFQLRQQQPTLTGAVRPPPQLMKPIGPGEIPPEKIGTTTPTKSQQ